MRTPDYSNLLTTPELAEDGLRKINRFMIGLLQQHSLEDLLWSIVDQAGQLLGFEDCVVYLIEGDELVQMAAFAASDPLLRSRFRDFRLPLGAGVVGSVALSGEARVVHDTRREPDYRPDDFSGLSELAVPIVFEDRILGVFDSESRRPHAYSEVDQAIFQSVANIASSRIAWALAERERRSAQTELEAKNAELERFNYTISHDLKSPLITVQGFLGLAERQLQRGQLDRALGDLAHARTAVTKMGVLLDDLLHVSRAGRTVAQRALLDLGDLAREAVQQTNGQIAARGVELWIDPALPTVLGDRARLLQVLQNLIANAVKFMGDQCQPRIEISYRPEEPRADCLVRDNGLGIEPRHHAAVFELFDRLHPEIDGTGIGLALVKRILDAHGGQVWVESTGAGQGSTFCFALPSTEVPCSHQLEA